MLVGLAIAEGAEYQLACPSLLAMTALPWSPAIVPPPWPCWLYCAPPLLLKTSTRAIRSILVDTTKPRISAAARSCRTHPPRPAEFFEHTYEGPDDMPGHVKSSLCGVSITLPVTGGSAALGRGQGLFVCEHRNIGGWGSGHSRSIAIAIVPEVLSL